jgi:hypothetical protein
MVTPEIGTATFVGRSGRAYTIDVYLSDVAAVACTFNANGAAAAGSLQYWRTPEDVVLRDFSIITGLTATVGMIWLRDGATIPGSIIRMANHLNTNPYRPTLNMLFKAGTLIGATQV